MQSRAQRRQYGEPVEAAFPEDSLRARHTRGLEAELVSIECSALQIRSPRVHVPFRLLRAPPRAPRKPLNENGHAICALKLASPSLSLGRSQLNADTLIWNDLASSDRGVGSLFLFVVLLREANESGVEVGTIDG